MRKLIAPLSYLTVWAAIFMSSTAGAQVAPVNPPLNGFQVDGNLISNSPTSPSPFAANQGDWLFGTGYTGTPVFDNSGNSNYGSQALRTQDAYNSSSDIIFTEGSKFSDDPNTWAWSSNTAPNKNDINNTLYLVTKDASNNDWLILGGDRLATTGTSYIDFELYQKTLTRNTSNNGFTSLGTQGGRTVNDLVISMQYSNGGGKPNVFIYQWKLVSPGKYDYVLIPLSTVLGDGHPLSDYVYAETNRAGSVDVAFGAFGSTQYQQFAFCEAAVNMTKVIGALGSPCLGLSIKTMFVKTKASDQSNAALKDLVEPLQVSITFGSASLNAAGPFCPTGTYQLTLSSGSVTGGTFTSTPSGLSMSSTGLINMGASSPGTYKIYYNYTTNGCNKKDSINVTINSLPTVQSLSGGSYCAGSTKSSVVMGGSQSTVSYQLQVQSGSSWVNVGSAVTGTGSSINFGPQDAGTYRVTTLSTSGCRDTFGSAVVTEVPLPTKQTLTGGSYCQGGTPPNLILGGTQTGVSYKLQKQNGANWDSVTTFTGNGSLHDFGSQAAGTYRVVETRTSSPSCPVITDNASIIENARASGPTLSIVNPDCQHDSGTITVVSPSNPASPAAPLYEYSNNGGPWQTGNTFKFAAGKGYSIKVRPIANPDCVSDSTVCPNLGPVSSPTTPFRTTTTSVKESEINKVDGTQLLVYPNPFSSEVKFEFKVDHPAPVALYVYDMDGRLVRTVFNEQMEPGVVKQAIMDGADLPNGIYFGRMMVGSEVVKISKIILQR